jgi:hypothetical protein
VVNTLITDVQSAQALLADAGGARPPAEPAPRGRPAARPR